MNKLAKIITATVGAVALFGGGALIGASVVASGDRTSTAEMAANPVPCNLRMVWDRVSQSYTAVYEDSAFASSSAEYGRTANLSCSDVEIIEWQEQRGADGLDEKVCRPVLSSGEEDGVVRAIGCAVPVLVVDEGSR